MKADTGSEFFLILSFAVMGPQQSGGLLTFGEHIIIIPFFSAVAVTQQQTQQPPPPQQLMAQQMTVAQVNFLFHFILHCC